MTTTMHPGVELSADRRFERRVGRLVVVSAVALGVITVLAIVGTDAPVWVIATLAAGWVLMPLLLGASLMVPRLRYGLALPAVLVLVGLVAICAAWPPTAWFAVAGWWVTTGGVAMGSTLGTWFWYRMLPVPARLDDPYAPARLRLIAIHAGLVVIGISLVALTLPS